MTYFRSLGLLSNAILRLNLEVSRARSDDSAASQWISHAYCSESLYEPVDVCPLLVSNHISALNTSKVVYICVDVIFMFFHGYILPLRCFVLHSCTNDAILHSSFDVQIWLPLPAAKDHFPLLMLVVWKSKKKVTNRKIRFAATISNMQISGSGEMLNNQYGLKEHAVWDEMLTLRIEISWPFFAL